ncbi:hypothetical protein L6R50_08545 [Myxococcota bacterium]|nr:hypothetical protein [Myxococcota bacterium]
MSPFHTHLAELVRAARRRGVAALPPSGSIPRIGAPDVADRRPVGDRA